MTVRSGIVGIWVIATGVLIATLYLGRAIFAPFAMAVFLFLIMEGFARVIDERVKFLTRDHSRIISILGVLIGFGLFIGLLARGIGQFGEQASDYEAKINGLIGDVYGTLSMGKAPTLTEIMFNDTGQRFFATIANAAGDLSGDIVIILIYVAFLFLAQSAWGPKLDRIFTEEESRSQVQDIGDAARRGIETYLWTQTVISAMITGLTYITLIALGVENAIFLSALIFVLNYIPTIGSIVAAFVPTLFALVQPELPGWIPGGSGHDSYFYAIFVFVGVSFWQFMIGNFVQPRIMGETLNLSALVVLLSLAIWGAIWGIPGMFLSAPLTVLLMILFAQSPSTRWISVLLSADGNPGGALEAMDAQVENETAVRPAD
ncbi:AI-2E family transporter [Henriciella litoralis]|uniref:AI-2E family transporter n=1 Tax=Henriciella litoralis TaxID=568102 RepID=UPI000A0537C6|nr:AI-2E family transporter [Henriciella litoralis]